MLEFYDDLLAEDGNFILNEMYKGKTKSLLELEKMIDENRQKYYRNFRVSSSTYTDKDFIKIGNKIAEIFNFKLVDFNLVNDPAPNAFTIPAGFSFAYNASNITNKIETDGNELRFKNKSLCAVIRATTGLWFNELFTSGEVTAIILHEVGHNFQQEVNKNLKTFMSCVWIVSLATNISTGQFNAILYNDSEIRAYVNDWAKNNIFGSIIKIGSAIRGIDRAIYYELMSLVNLFTLGLPTSIISLSNLLLSAIYNPTATAISIIVSPMKKGAENVSDTWASDHGYGPELISALSKMSLDPDAAGSAIGRLSKKLPLFDSLCTLFGLPAMILGNLIAAHPIPPKRAANIVSDLRRELRRSDVSPQMKKEIEKQIEEIEILVNQMTKCDNPLQGTALRKFIFKLNADLESDPKGFIQKTFSSKDYMKEEYDIDYDDIFIYGLD